MSTSAQIATEPPVRPEPRRRRGPVVPAAWRGALLSGLGSLLGILLAFGINAWWSARGEAARERAYLAALRTELTHARAAVVRDRATLSKDIEDAREIVAILSSPGATTLSEDSVVALERIGPLEVFTPPRAALDDVIESGGLTLIRSDSLRRLLASYEQALASDLHEQETVSDIWLRHLAPYRYDHSNMQRLIGRRFQTRPLGYAIDRDAFVRNRTYANLLLARVLRVRNVTVTHDSIMAQIDRILPRLREY